MTLDQAVSHKFAVGMLAAGILGGVSHGGLRDLAGMLDLSQLSHEAVFDVVNRVLVAHPAEVGAYRQGAAPRVVNFLMGQAMRLEPRLAPTAARAAILEALDA